MYNQIAQPGCGSPPSGGRVASRTEDEQLLQQEVERGSDPLRKEPRPEHGSGPAAEGAQERPVRPHDHAEHDEVGDGPRSASERLPSPSKAHLRLSRNAVVLPAM